MEEQKKEIEAILKEFADSKSPMAKDLAVLKIQRLIIRLEAEEGLRQIKIAKEIINTLKL